MSEYNLDGFDIGDSNVEIEDEDLLNFFLSGDNLDGLTPDVQMHGLTPESQMHSSNQLQDEDELVVPISPRSSAFMHSSSSSSNNSFPQGALGLSGLKNSASSQMIASMGSAQIGHTSQFLGGGFGGGGGFLGTANEVHDPRSSQKFNTNYNSKIPKSNKSMNLSGKNASNEGDDDDDKGDASGSTEDKKARRLARNRESARQSRRRKKQYLELLEDKVEQLTQEVNLLRQKRLEQAAKELHQQWQSRLSTLEPAADALTTELQRLEDEKETMSPAVKEGLSNLEKKLRIAKIRFGPNSSEYLKILNHHFDLMKQTLLPPYTRFLLWAMDQGDEFFKGGSQRNRGKIKSQSNVTSKVTPGTGKSGNAANLWPLLWNELGLTYEQEEKTKATFASLNTEENIRARRELVVAMNLIDRIHRVALVHGKNMQSMADRLANVLTPSQQVRFFAWYERNRKRIHDCGLDRGLSKTGNQSNHLQAAASNILANKNLTMHNVCEYVDLLHKLHGNELNQLHSVKEETEVDGDVKMK